jgi:hypothetical protein
MAWYAKPVLLPSGKGLPGVVNASQLEFVSPIPPPRTKSIPGETGISNNAFAITVSSEMDVLSDRPDHE